MRKSLLLTILIVTILSIASLAQRPLIALYHDDGVWRDGLIATEHMLDWIGIPWKEVTADDLNNTGLEGFSALWIGGGWAPDYERKIRESGRQAILEMIKQGGAYIGICAGAYYAASTVRWEGESYPYSLKLFLGTAAGPEIYSWPHYGMAKLEMNPEHPINADEGKEESMLLYGGGYFVPASGQKIDIVATYEQTDHPAIITFSYGKGRVVLLGVHPEIEEDDRRDGISFAKWLNDEGSDWPFMKAALSWAIDSGIEGTAGYGD